MLDTSNPRAFAGVLRRLRTELGKLPGSAESLRPLLARLPADGAGLTLDALRGADDAQIARTLRALSTRLADAAAALADDVGLRYFTLAQGADQRVRHEGDVSAELEVVHETRYDYAAPVRLAHHLAHLQPLDDAGQRLLAFDLDIAPPHEPARTRWTRSATRNATSAWRGRTSA